MPDEEDVGRQETLLADPNGAGPAEEEAEEQAPDWSVLGEDAVALREKKGWKDPGQLVKAYQELETARMNDATRASQAEQRLAEYERYMEELANERTAGRQPQGEEAGFDWATVGEAFERDPGNTMAWYTGQVIAPMIEQLIADKLGEVRKNEIEPLGQMMGGMHWEREATRLRGVYGDQFAELSDDVIGELQRDTSLSQRADGMELAYAKVRARKDAAEAADRRRAAGASTLDTSARAARQAESQADAIRRAIREAGGVRRQDDPL